MKGLPCTTPGCTNEQGHQRTVCHKCRALKNWHRIQRQKKEEKLCPDCQKNKRTRYGIYCEPCGIARTVEARKRAREKYKSSEEVDDFTEVEDWHPTPRPVIMSDAEQDAIDKREREKLDCRPSAIRTLTPEEIAALQPTITPVSQIKFTRHFICAVNDYF